MALSLSDVVKLLSYAGPIVSGLVLVRLALEGLLRRYRCFALYLAYLLGEIVVLLTVPQKTEHYFYTFVAVESVEWIAQILVILELFSLVLRGYPAIARTGRNFAAMAFIGAVVLSLGLAVVNHQTGTGQYRILEQYLLVSRTIAFTLLAFFILILGFLFWFPIPLSRNVAAYAIGYSVYFTVRALLRLASNLFASDRYPVLNAISLGIILGCLVYWLFSLTRRGEAVDVTVGHRWQPAQVPLLVEQLESINTALLRTARK